MSALESKEYLELHNRFIESLTNNDEEWQLLRQILKFMVKVVHEPKDELSYYDKNKKSNNFISRESKK